MSRLSRACLLAAILVVLGAVGAVSAVGATSHARPAVAKAATITLHKTNAGTILVATGGGVLFYFTRDHGTKSTCFGTCASVWPPFDSSHPVAGPGVEKKLISTVKRGSARQVTYDGHPLYFYATPGIEQQSFYIGVDNFGGDWLGVKANGAGVK